MGSFPSSRICTTTKKTCFKARSDEGVHASSGRAHTSPFSPYPQFIFLDFSLSITQSSQNLCGSSTKAFCDKGRHERSTFSLPESSGFFTHAKRSFETFLTFQCEEPCPRSGFSADFCPCAARVQTDVDSGCSCKK